MHQLATRALRFLRPSTTQGTPTRKKRKRHRRSRGKGELTQTATPTKVEVTEGPLVYRTLLPEEWDKLDPIRPHMEGPLPTDPTTASCVVAENDKGDIVGFLFMQMQFHMEPINIHPQYRGKVNFKRLVSTLLSTTPDGFPYFVFSPSPRIGKMCRSVGMERKPWHVWFGVKGQEGQ